MNLIYVYISLAIGLVGGIAIGWMLGSWRAHRRYTRNLDELTQFHKQLNRRSS